MTVLPRDVTAAVVTGGHSYDVPNFHRLFRAMDGVDAYVQPMDDFAASPEAVREAYDAVVFYTMLRGLPQTKEELAWWQGDHRAALEHLGTTPQGIVMLHHAILGYPEWPLWRKWVGVPDPKFESYHFDETVRSEIAVADHPITAGLAAWEMTDETYVAAGPGGHSHVLITTDHPKSMRAIAWTREPGGVPERGERRSGHPSGRRVFCYQSGHDSKTWQEASFRQVLRRGILWAAGRL